MKKSVLIFALIIGLLASASTAMAQNMSRYITLTVKNGAAIRLNFRAAAVGTPVRIVSGSNIRNITVGTGWIGTASYTTGSTTMTIYGNITEFICYGNVANLTAIDLSHNTQLIELDCSYNQLTSLDLSHNTQLYKLNCSGNRLTTLDLSKNKQLKELFCFSNRLTTLDVSHNRWLDKLSCSGNNFSTQALDDIYCALPDRNDSTNYGIIFPVDNASDPNHATVLATNKQNAILKNWDVRYFITDISIPATTGSYVCGGGGTTYYYLKIAGVPVTSANCSNLSVISGVSGTVKYDPSTKTLTLQNATIQTNTANAIFSEIDGLTIKVIGTNNLTTGDYSTLRFRKPLTITGGGVLNANSENSYAIYAERTNLTIDGCTVNAKGRYGIVGQYGSSETLTIKNSTVTAEGTAGSIADFASLTLDGCAITQPAGAAFDASLKAVALGGAVVKSKVVISPTGGGTTTYDLSIAGVQITSANCSDLSVIDSVSGTVKYDPSTKVLTLENATIQTNINNAIVSLIDGLTIKVIGTNNLTTENNAAFYFIKPLTITGSGVLNANSGTTCAIYSSGTNLTIDGCIVNAKGKWGITGYDGSSETLTIKNSTVTAEGTDGSIADFASLTLDGCAITQPVGAAFDASLHAVALGGSKVTSKVVISKNSTDIAEATAEQALNLYPNPVADVLYLSATARTIRVYDIYGIEVAQATDTDRVEVSHLPAGVYTVKADGTVAKMVKR